MGERQYARIPLSTKCFANSSARLLGLNVANIQQPDGGLLGFLSAVGLKVTAVCKYTFCPYSILISYRCHTMYIRYDTTAVRVG